MPKDKGSSQTAPGDVQSVAYSTGKSKTPLGQSGHLSYQSGKVDASKYRAKAARSMVRGR